MPKFSLTTPLGTEDAVSRERLAEALAEADRSEDPDAFVVVTREDGVFVQLAAGGPLEVGGIGDLPHRLDHAALARAVLDRLERGEDPWGELPRWDLASLRERERRGNRRSRFYLVLAATALGLFVAALLWFTRA